MRDTYKKTFLCLKMKNLASPAVLFLIIMLSATVIFGINGCSPKKFLATEDITAAQSGQNEETSEKTETGATDKTQQDPKDDISAQETTTEKQAENIAYEPALLNAETAGSFTADGLISDKEYSGFINPGGFDFYWANDSEYVYFGMIAKTSGFVSCGIQPGNMMKDADIIFGFVDSISISIYDMFSTGNFGPHPTDVELGGTDDIVDFGGSEQGGYTIIEFKRLLATGDKYDNDIVKGINKIIWSYGNADSIDGTHSKRGYVEIEIK